jgi:hypothetical protein
VSDIRSSTVETFVEQLNLKAMASKESTRVGKSRSGFDHHGRCLTPQFRRPDAGAITKSDQRFYRV